jgi:hypothetical protein
VPSFILAVFLLLDDILELLLTSDLLDVLHGVFEKPSGHFLGLIVMSH